MKKLLSILYGAAYGVATVVPGLSGGTLLVLFGVYDKVCSAMSLDMKSIKQNLPFLCMFGIGAVVGVIGFAKVVKDVLIEHFPLWTFLTLALLMLITLPSIIKTAYKSDNGSLFKPSCFVPIILGAAVIVALFLAEMFGVFGADAADTAGTLKLGIAAAIAAVVMVIPGVSGSFMLVAFGIYETCMGALKDLARLNFDWSVLVPVGIGVVLGIVLGAKLVMFLLKRWRVTVYSAIIGMVAASVVMLVVDSVIKYA